ncbi:MAG: fatty acid desaturase family protein [bacterium]
MLTKEEVKQFSQTSAFRSSLSLALDWLGIAALFAALIYFPHPVTYVICFILMGRQQLALAIMMHDGAHGRLYKSPKVNDYLGQLFTGAPLFFSQDSYRKFHLKHHLEPLVSTDPDISLIGGYPISRGSFYRKLFRDLVGISYFKFIGYFFYKPRKKKTGDGAPKVNLQNKRLPMWFQAGSVVVVNGLLFATLAYLGHPWYFLFFWFLPMTTILQVLLRIRGVAEHAGYQPNANQMLCSRTVVNPLQTFFFAPHQVNYHMEHHQYPSIPYFHLPKVHRLMKGRQGLPAQNIYRGYGKVISELLN